MSDKKIKVVLSGSGLKYPVHGGAITCLHDHGFRFEALAGVSGGALIAAAVASGYAPGDDLQQLVMSTLPGPNELWDRAWLPFSGLPYLGPKYGVYWGDLINKVLEDRFPDSIGESTIPLKVFAVDVYTKKHIEFCTEGTPYFPLAKAVRASMSLPFVFDPVKNGDQLLVDGGVASNFPLDVFGEGRGVIGLRFRGKPAPHKSLSRIDFGLAILDSMMEASNREHVEDAIWAKTILLDTDGTSLDLDMSEEKARKLWEDGYKSVASWLINNDYQI